MPVNPGGSDGELQFNNAGIFGGAPSLTYSTTDDSLNFSPSGPNSAFGVNPGDGAASAFLEVTPLLILLTTATGTTRIEDGSGNPIIEANSVNHLGFFAATPIAKPTVTGVKLPSDVVIASLLTALKNLGLITDSTT